MGTGRVRGHSLLTDVDDVSLLVQHDVAIVPVLDLQQEQQEAVGRHASDEVVARLWRGLWFHPRSVAHTGGTARSVGAAVWGVETAALSAAWGSRFL